MKSITIQLSSEDEQRLRALSERAQRPPEEMAGELIRRRLRLDRFHELCQESEQLAQAAGYASEDDLLKDIS